jgi:hypothetical protein
MAKRKTPIDKAMATLARDPRVLRVWSEGDNGCGDYRDGYVEDVWVDLRAGFISADDMHCIHESTPERLLSALEDLEPCDCQSCVDLIAKGAERP